METLEGFPNLPAFWLRRAKPGCANAMARPQDILPARTDESGLGLAYWVVMSAFV
jgi:hypothetical protein